MGYLGDLKFQLLLLSKGSSLSLSLEIVLNLATNFVDKESIEK